MAGRLGAVGDSPPGIDFRVVVAGSDTATSRGPTTPSNAARRPRAGGSGCLPAVGLDAHAQATLPQFGCRALVVHKQEAYLDGREPQRQPPGVLLAQERHHPLYRPDSSAVSMVVVIETCSSRPWTLPIPAPRTQQPRGIRVTAPLSHFWEVVWSLFLAVFDVRDEGFVAVGLRGGWGRWTRTTSS